LLLAGNVLCSVRLCPLLGTVSRSPDKRRTGPNLRAGFLIPAGESSNFYTHYPLQNNDLQLNSW
jgi:hypothetical protein